MSGSKTTDKRDTLERIRVTAGKPKELSQKRASIHRKIKGGRLNKGERGRGCVCVCVCTREQKTEQNAHQGSRREGEREREREGLVLSSTLSLVPSPPSLQCV
jgi:hypothetical protein